LFDVYAADLDYVGAQWPRLCKTGLVAVDQNERGTPAHDVGHGWSVGTKVPSGQLGGRAVGERVVADRAEMGGQRVDQPLAERHAVAGVREQMVNQVRGMLRVGYAPVQLR